MYPGNTHEIEDLLQLIVFDIESVQGHAQDLKANSSNTQDVSADHQNNSVLHHTEYTSDASLVMQNSELLTEAKSVVLFHRAYENI